MEWVNKNLVSSILTYTLDMFLILQTQILSMVCTVCPRYYAHFYIASHCMKMDIQHLPLNNVTYTSTAEKTYHMNSTETPCSASNAAHYLGAKFIPTIQVPIATMFRW